MNCKKEQIDTNLPECLQGHCCCDCAFQCAVISGDGKKSSYVCLLFISTTGAVDTLDEHGICEGWDRIGSKN
jgi:hypothetical protein